MAHNRAMMSEPQTELIAELTRIVHFHRKAQLLSLPFYGQSLFAGIATDMYQVKHLVICQLATNYIIYSSQAAFNLSKARHLLSQKREDK